MDNLGRTIRKPDLVTCEQQVHIPGREVIKREYGLRLKIKRNDWLLSDTCPQAANHCTLF